MEGSSRRGFKFCPLCGYRLRWRRENGRKRSACRKCGWVHYENPLPVAVCVVKNKNGKILIAKRNLRPGIGRWALPGGFIESNEAPEIACLRELEEETGLKGKIKRLAGIYSQDIRHHGSFLVIGYEASVSKNTLSLNSELKEAGFFSEKDLPVIPFSSHRKIIENVLRQGRRPRRRLINKGDLNAVWFRKGQGKRR
ncbi:MAG: NUDIX hydrolase [Candidatus Omnitrophica bacterium]|nr:NUDIX hydrolase [Candidatus Omnitrophota bacterium]